MTNVEDTLKQRDEDYGDFKSQAKISQDIKKVMQNTPNWYELTKDKREVLEMLAHKIARILNGNPEIYDHWHDIIGYARLVEKTLKPIRPPRKCKTC